MVYNCYIVFTFTVVTNRGSRPPMVKEIRIKVSGSVISATSSNHNQKALDKELHKTCSNSRQKKDEFGMDSMNRINGRIIKNPNSLETQNSTHISNNPKTNTPNVTKKPAFNPAALLVGAIAGPSISAGEGAGEIPVYLCLEDNTTTTNFWPCSQ
ncbi:hypothetical protein QQP08_025880 [Theobroma cacao]|nr:hypothetical protein QQP08_025880 [Theobroma cacao]